MIKKWIAIYSSLAASLCMLWTASCNSRDERQVSPKIASSSKLTSSSKLASSQDCIEPSFKKTVSVAKGQVVQGGGRYFVDEYAIVRPRIEAFDIDVHEVTNGQFQKFVEKTGYVTRAERGLAEDEYSALPDFLRQPGSTVFVKPDRKDKTVMSYVQWWQFVPGASWKHPQGPHSSIAGKDHYPVVHMAYEDALAYAQWAGRDLPTEDQWEYAARYTADAKLSPAKMEEQPEPTTDHQEKTAPTSPPRNANIWQGLFPYINEGRDGYEGLAPVGCFEPDAIGLHDMIGNVWEWTSSPYAVDRKKISRDVSFKGHDPNQPGIAVNVIKGGSFLCAENYCARFRAEARHAQDLMLGTSHIGFRTVSRPGELGRQKLNASIR